MGMDCGVEKKKKTVMEGMKLNGIEGYKLFIVIFLLLNSRFSSANVSGVRFSGKGLGLFVKAGNNATRREMVPPLLFL